MKPGLVGTIMMLSYAYLMGHRSLREAESHKSILWPQPLAQVAEQIHLDGI